MEETEEYIILEDRDEQGNVGVYGLWIFSEPEPSSTEGTRERVATVITDCAARAGATTIAARSSASGDGGGMIREVSRSSQTLSKQQHDGPIEVSPLNDHPSTYSTPPQPQQPPITSPSRSESRDILGDLLRKAGLHFRNL